MKKFLFALGLGFAGAFFFFRLPLSYGRQLAGYVMSISERENGDFVLKMSNDHHDFRIHNGRDLNIDLKRLKTKLIGQNIVLWYTHPQWPVDMTPYVTRLVKGGKVVYTKW